MVGNYETKKKKGRKLLLESENTDTYLLELLNIDI